MRTFHALVIGIFAFVGVAGIVAFALFGGFGKEANPYGQSVVIWGTLDDAPFVRAISELQTADENFQVVSYVQKDSRTFVSELVNALAEGRGPDILILTNDLILSQRAKLFPIPYETYSERTYKDTYVDGAEVFMLNDGIYALPIAVDPLVLYWNRDAFATKGLAQPPRTWEELVSVTVPRLVERDFTRNILRAAVAFGEYINVRNAKAVLSLLMFQAGSSITVDAGDRMLIDLSGGSAVRGIPPAQAALTFFSEFANPQKDLYTWNRGLRQDRDMFLSGDLALYFGFGSEHGAIQDGNPNLSFDVAEVPQGADARFRRGYGTFYGMAVTKNSPNIGGAFRALYKLAAQVETENYARAFGFGPVYRASHATGESDPVRTNIRRASLIARGWLDPNPSGSDNVFRQMVEDVVSGRLDINQAIGDAETRLKQLLVP